METEKNITNTFNEYKEFIKDKQVSFIIRKTERIVYGVYLLSHFIPAKETLRNSFKKTSHKLLENTSLFVDLGYLNSESINYVHGLLQHLSSLLTLSYIEGYISQSNIEIMKNEINYLHKHIEELSTHARSDIGQLQLKSDQFVVSQPKKSPMPQGVPKVQIPKMSFRKKSASSNPLVKKTAPKSGILATKETKPVKTESLESREKSVIDVIRDKGKVSIKDITTVIFDVSEKTIQRTLQTLIDKGQVVKEGERRWARYELK